MPLPTATFCVHEVSGLPETAVAEPTPEMVVTSVAVPGWPLNALPWRLLLRTEQSSLMAIVPVTPLSEVVKSWSPAAQLPNACKKAGVITTPASPGSEFC